MYTVSRHTTRAKLRSSCDDSPPRIYLQSFFTLVETVSRSRRMSGFWRSIGEQCHGRLPICASCRQQMSDESSRKKAHLYQLVIATNYYVPEESMMMDEDENSGSHRNQ